MTRVKSQIQHDYKSLVKPHPNEGQVAGRRWFYLGLVLPVAIVAGVLLMSRGNAAPASSNAPDANAEPSRSESPVDVTPAVAGTENIAKSTTDVVDVRAIRAIDVAPAPVQDPAKEHVTAEVSSAAALPPEPGAVTVAYAAPKKDTTTVSLDIPSAPRSRPTPDAASHGAPPISKSVADTQVRDKAIAAAGGGITRPLALPAPTATPATSAAAEADLPGTPLTLTIKSGDSLDALFGRHGLSRGDLATLLTLPEAKEALTVLMPGDKIDLRRDDERVVALTRRLDEQRTLHVSRNSDAFQTRIETTPVEIRIQHASATIDSSLFLAAKAAGISDTLTMNLAGIFAWDIDFVLDIRKGDRFSVIYEEIWQDGRRLRDGNILAARFVNDGDAFEAVRYVDPDDNPGYFTPDGVNVRKAFLRAPIKFTPRVTSNFNPRRMHPVHNRVRPHRGVDYGAPTGTPILAAGDGKVIFRGRKGGYGNTVILQHGGNITTLYAHMSKFNRKVRSGSRVRQGQVIGYVGATGTVTARHLHYEYRVNGVHRNPRTVKLPKAKPIPNKFAANFHLETAPLLSQLSVVSRERPVVAMGD